MEKEANSRDRPARENYCQLMRHEDSGSAREPPEKPVCTEYPECEGCPYPGHGFVCWRERCMRKETERIQRRNVACCGISIQPVLKTLEQMPQADTVLLCLDNDEAGQKANRRMAEQLEAEGLTVMTQIPKMKDWNDNLLTSQQHAVQFAGL